MKSWRTTLLGVVMILGALASAAVALLDNDPATTVNLPAVGAAFTAGIGLILARDNGVTSESAGAK